MPRPTLVKENEGRGNSFYVEGKNDTKYRKYGWDPGHPDNIKAGCQENYRGDSARIIFYCCVASSALTLIDEESDETVDYEAFVGIFPVLFHNINCFDIILISQRYVKNQKPARVSQTFFDVASVSGRRNR